MFGIVIIISLAVIFYRIGDSDYNRGWLLAILSVVASYGGAAVFGFLGLLGANVLLFLGLFAYNLFTKKPPGSQSGF